MRASWNVLQWDHRETLKNTWNSKADNWAPNSMYHTLSFYFPTRSCTNATTSKQVIAGRVRSSLNFFKLRMLRRHSKYYYVFASTRNFFCHVRTASGCWRDHHFALSSWFTMMLAPTRSHGWLFYLRLINYIHFIYRSIIIYKPWIFKKSHLPLNSTLEPPL